MLLLVTDTSGKNGSVALARAAQGSASCEVDLIEAVALAGGTFSAQLVPQIAALLAKRSLHKSDIGAFVVASGPGSFTGLRVGLAAIKALAEILRKPIVPVSLLEVVAITAGKSGKVLAALDAGRGEVYAGEYELVSDSARLKEEQLLRRADIKERAAGLCIVTPDESVERQAREAGIDILRVAAPEALAIARLGWRKLQAGQSVSPEQLEANYIRRSDAEIFAKPGT
jgi:tRNA threonylcarbamoyladenosine biosynthesis protein TsaB